jgi:hypothetical protein
MLTIMITQAPTNYILPRQSSGGDSCPSTIDGGTIAGIVIGSIAGTLFLQLLWWFFKLPGAWVCCGGSESDDYNPPIVRERERSTHHRKRRRSHPTTTTHMSYGTSRMSSVRSPPKVYEVAPR